MNEWAWTIGGMTRAAETQIIGTKACLRSVSDTTNPICLDDPRIEFG